MRRFLPPPTVGVRVLPRRTETMKFNFERSTVLVPPEKARSASDPRWEKVHCKVTRCCYCTAIDAQQRTLRHDPTSSWFEQNASKSDCSRQTGQQRGNAASATARTGKPGAVLLADCGRVGRHARCTDRGHKGGKIWLCLSGRRGRGKLRLWAGRSPRARSQPKLPVGLTST